MIAPAPAAPPAPPVFLIGGATATGKSALAEGLAARFGLPIIGADTMQMYRDLPIAAASPAARPGVEYHLTGFLGPAETFSAGEFVRLATPIAASAAAAGRPAIVCGGTGLYLRALRVALSSIPAIDPAVRARLTDTYIKEGGEATHRRLADVDPVAAAATPAANRNRLVRALEVFEATGRPISEWWARDRDAPPPTVVRAWMVVDRNPADLEARIVARLGAMLAAGLLDEVRDFSRRCRDTGLNPAETPAARTLGIANLIAALDDLAPDDAGPWPRSLAEAAATPALAAALERMRLQTRQYAKRQRTWLRKDAAEAHWLNASERSPGELLDEASELLRPHLGERSH